MIALQSCVLLISLMTFPKASWADASNNAYFSCAFEHDDICGFEHLTYYVWIRHRGSTSRANTGPSGDHTTGTGFYMYSEDSGTKTMVALGSPFQTVTDPNGICVEFYYHMHDNSGPLEVNLFSGTSDNEEEIFSISGDQGNRWWQALIHINPPPSQWRIIFNGQQGYGNIAIDDVSFIPGPCPTPEPFYQYWTTTSGTIPTVTLWGDIQGIRLAGGTHLNGRLEVLYNGVWGTVCGLNGWGLNSMRVACKELGFLKAQTSTFQGGSDQFDASSGPIWMSGVNCNGQESSLSDCQHDGFGVINSCTHWNDVQLTCQDNARLQDFSTCTFENDTCGFYNLNGDDFDWTRHQGPTLSTDTGPSGDHTTGTGYYMYVETSSGLVGWEARLASVAYVGTGTEGLCLNFYYHMYGSSVGALNVVRTPTPGTPYKSSYDEVIFTASEDHGNRWQQASVHFSYANDWGIMFEVIRGPSYTGDIAIDDVLFTPGPCPTQEPRINDVVLSCSSSSFQVDIPKNLTGDNYVASDFYLSGDPNNFACKGFYNGANYISLNSSLAECGTQYYNNGTHLLYQNMVEIDTSDGNTVVDFLGVEIPITCEYNSSAKVQTHFKTLNDVIRKQEKGSFNFDFSMYTDITYSTRYQSYPVEVKLNEELYFRAELLMSSSNLEIHLRSCRATPSPDYDDPVVYEFIQAGCGINDAPVRVLATNKQTQADFEIKSFRFRKDLGNPDSQIWIHCEVVVCDDSDSDSECRHGCEQPRHRRSVESPSLRTKRMVQGPIKLMNHNNGNSDIFTKSEENGVSGTLTVFLSAVSLVMLISLVAMGVVLTKFVKSSKRQGYQPLPDPLAENVTYIGNSSASELKKLSQQ